MIIEKMIHCSFWLKNNLFRYKAVRQYNESLRNNELTSTELKQLNWNKRKEIVEFVYEHIPYYKRYYSNAGFNPGMLQTEADWEKVPILEKDAIRESFDNLIMPNTPNNIIGVSTTGGSTGKPLKVYTDKRFHIEILGWRAFHNWGVSPAANVGIIHRRVPTTFIPKLKNRLLWWPTKRAYLNASSIGDKDLDLFVKELISKKVVWLQGYVGGLERVADYILEHQIELSTIKLVWSTSAPLCANVRLKLERAFRCKIMNQYGCNEVANIAMQCPKGDDLHILSDYIHVDVVDENSKLTMNKEGDILVTDLNNYVFPLIKYRLGDKGTLLPNLCRCGNALPLMKEVKGRISDAVYTPNGVYIDGNYLNSIFDSYSEFISQFQVYQKEDYSVTVLVKVYKNNKETDNILDSIKLRLEQDTKHEIPVCISRVNHIDDDRGKIRYIISEIALKKLQK